MKLWANCATTNVPRNHIVEGLSSHSSRYGSSCIELCFPELTAKRSELLTATVSHQPEFKHLITLNQSPQFRCGRPVSWVASGAAGKWSGWHLSTNHHYPATNGRPNSPKLPFQAWYGVTRCYPLAVPLIPHRSVNIFPQYARQRDHGHFQSFHFLLAAQTGLQWYGIYLYQGIHPCHVRIRAEERLARAFHP